MFKRIKNQLTGKSGSPPPPEMRPPREGDARPHHYMLAHRILPSIFFRDPTTFLTIMNHPKALGFLQMQWDTLAKHVAVVEPYTGLDYEIHKLEDDTTIILVTMPLPLNVTEAYFVAAVYRPPTATEPALARYFTYEFGANFIPGEAQRTVLGEWTAQIEHLNYGGHNRTSDKTEFIKTVSEKFGSPMGSDLRGSSIPRSE